MTEEMQPFVNLWIAVLHAGIEDAILGWRDSVEWLGSNDFNEICAYVNIRPDYAISLYHKRYKPVELKDRKDIFLSKERETNQVLSKCKVCFTLMLVNKHAKTQKKTCSYICSTQIKKE